MKRKPDSITSQAQANRESSSNVYSTQHTLKINVEWKNSILHLSTPDVWSQGSNIYYETLLKECCRKNCFSLAMKLKNAKRVPITAWLEVGLCLAYGLWLTLGCGLLLAHEMTRLWTNPKSHLKEPKKNLVGRIIRFKTSLNRPFTTIFSTIDMDSCWKERL